MIPVSPLTPEECISRIRPREEDIRGPYFRDQTAIIHSNAFRRLKHKTQVFFSPEHDHLCTRIEHVLHVATIAATICKGLNDSGWALQPEMAYAAGLGHDLGHAPCGHLGETVLSELLKRDAGIPFSHESHSLRILNVLENDGLGLNLTRGVRDAIVCHNGERFEQYLTWEPVPRLPEEKQGDPARLPATPEGCIVRLSDKIAYLGRDLEDAILAGLVKESEIPGDILRELGPSNGHIINTLVLDLIDQAASTGRLGLSDARQELFVRLYRFNLDHIYNHPVQLTYTRQNRAMLKTLYERLLEVDALWEKGAAVEHAGELEHGYIDHVLSLRRVYEAENAPAPIRVVDYIAGMTDRYAVRCYTELTIPRPIA